MHQPTAPVRHSRPAAINRLIAAALGVQLSSDGPERLARWHLPCPPNARRRERIAAIRERGVLFIHVPKNAGTSVCERLYGRQIKHETVRYYAMVAPDLLELPSFAIVRDPLARFLSAYRYACNGGTRDRAVARPFHARYRAFAGIDDAIDHLACARSPFDIDHIFRPQSWYLTDAAGECRMDTLVPHEALGHLGDVIGLPGLADLPRLNRCVGPAAPKLDPSQEAFVRDFYAEDFALRQKAMEAHRPAATAKAA